MTPADLLAQVKAGRLAPAYLLHGPERLLREEAASAVQLAVLAGGIADFNLDRFFGKETDAGALENALGTVPMMAPLRLVVVRQIEEAPAAAREVIVRYLEKPSPTTVLLLSGEQVDARTTFFRTVAAAGCVVKFETPSERDLVPWCRERARLVGGTLGEEEARLLVEAVGRDLCVLNGALERLVLFVGEGRGIDIAAVEEVVPESRLHSVFTLCDAVGAGETIRAWDLARKLVAQREPPLKLLALLARHFRQLLRLRELRDAGEAREAAGASLGLPPFALRNLWVQTARHTVGGLARAIERLSEADLTLKSSRLPDGIVLERLVLDLCRIEGKGGTTGSRRSY
jgi:DNA polymerase-3 subunit delta